ncbi:MAG: ATP-dependent DNA helicase [Gammaproteobacteria bacterium]|nr:ATP-dependent DNA helicase [Gammaproteobacteria bacterium]MBT8111528.1 ATP-dependent DNA helicase [Gammaproteobacteria bacterium]NND46277.1 ATP-dependent DNA helicase [Woeseiaceae bacterium]NNL46226.1 ATP-dependent DNA helicase [Woeseiaceae bacterium]
MAEAVAEAIANSDKLVVEAGTGTGKTFAYLLPALLSGRKTIISTGTKALQDQLYHRDLPLISKTVGRPVTTALLKGRANYLCLHRLDQVTEAASALVADLDEVRKWRHRTDSGDRAELIDVAEDSPVWPLATSTADNCLGQNCPEYSKCHVVKARRAAQEADLVVVNHHLLLADLAMKEEGFVEFLPGAEAIIIDEAHQMPDLAVQFFGVSLGSRELERLIDEARAATLPMAQPDLNRRIDKLQTALRELRASAPRKEGRHELSEVMAEIRKPLDELAHAIHDVQIAIVELGGATVDLEKIHEQLAGVAERLAVLSSDDAWDGLRWLEINPRSLRLNLTPLDVSTKLNGIIDNGFQAWIFTSATLAVGEDFSHFGSRMGLADVTGLTFPSPYSLQQNGLVYLPPDMPQPSDPGHTDAMLEAVTPLLDITTGGMFCLFTSHRALNNAKKWFRSHKSSLGGRHLLAQGDAPRDDLLRRFRQHGDAVLLGTGSFWEGVDVRGQALSVVAIDKLPFASPADPLMMARLEFIRRQGGNGFMDHQLPLAALSLKQGAGRLLRDERDFGVIVLCDPRILTKRYGKMFLQCLEPMASTSALSEVSSFLAAHQRKGAVA